MEWLSSPSGEEIVKGSGGVALCRSRRVMDAGGMYFGCGVTIAIVVQWRECCLPSRGAIVIGSMCLAYAAQYLCCSRHVGRVITTLLLGGSHFSKNYSTFVHFNIPSKVLLK